MHAEPEGRGGGGVALAAGRVIIVVTCWISLSRISSSLSPPPSWALGSARCCSRESLHAAPTPEGTGMVWAASE
eukprot:COSAG01_NODE_2030_length_8590_cov_20.238017_8_plen_74_part_00